MMNDDFARLMDAVRNAPHEVQRWIALGEALYDAGRLADAASVFDQAAAVHPDNSIIASFRGLCAQQLGDPDAAIGHYSLVLAKIPSDRIARHNRANALRAADRAEDALSDVEAAIASGGAAPETYALRGHVLADLGRLDDAIDQYRETVARAPSLIDAHDVLARLLPQVGRGAEAFDAIEAALTQTPHAQPLWHLALNLAHDFKDSARLADLVTRARSHLGDQPDLQVYAASAQGLGGDASGACAALTPVIAAHPDDAGLHTQMAHWRLCAGDVEAAQEAALAATQLDRMTQTSWSLLSIIWRLLGDPREAWLADYDRLVMTLDVNLPPGIAADLTRLHTLRDHPPEQSLRSGTQTRGYLFDRRTPSIQALGQNILSAVTAKLEELPDDPGHPFLSRKTSALGFATAWSVRLRSNGFHINHFHPKGWLSSALYVDIPDTLDEAHGALAFGVPDAAFGLDLTPRRIEVPSPGKLVIFPSYFWHGTLPFESDLPRLTVAFDALPV